MPTKREILAVKEESFDFIRKHGTINDSRAAVIIWRDIEKALDELEQPVEIPQCLADWIEGNKSAMRYKDYMLSIFWQDYQLIELNRCTELNTDLFTDELYDYAEYDDSIPIIKQAILTGNYTVKKEQLYYVPVPYQSNESS